MDFRFLSEFPVSYIDQITDMVTMPRLWIPNPKIIYPDIFDWAQKVHTELYKQIKRSIICINSKGNIVGIVIFQRHKTFRDALEIKHLNILPQVRNRYMASFLLRNAEIEGLGIYQGITRVVCDSKADNFIVQMFLLKHHYKIIDKQDLYNLRSGDDLLFEKKINPKFNHV